MLTPIEIQGKTFKSGRGYKKEDIDDFLFMVGKDYEALYKENLELKDKLNTMSEGLQYYKSIENTLQKALVLAEKTSNDTTSNAEKKAATIEAQAQTKAESIEAEAQTRAEGIIARARTEAENILSDSKKEVSTLEMKIVSMSQDYEKYRAQCKQMAKAQLELLEGDVYNVNFKMRDFSENKHAALKEENKPGHGIKEKSEEEPVSKTIVSGSKEEESKGAVSEGKEAEVENKGAVSESQETEGETKGAVSGGQEAEEESKVAVSEGREAEGVNKEEVSGSREAEAETKEAVSGGQETEGEAKGAVSEGREAEGVTKEAVSEGKEGESENKGTKAGGSKGEADHMASQEAETAATEAVPDSITYPKETLKEIFERLKSKTESAGNTEVKQEEVSAPLDTTDVWSQDIQKKSASEFTFYETDNMKFRHSKMENKAMEQTTDFEFISEDDKI